MTIAPYSTTTPEVSIRFWSQFYNVNVEQVQTVIDCESGGDPTIQSYAYKKDGTRENSWGLVQWNLDANPQITKAQALNPDWALPAMLRAWSEGHSTLWSCYKIYYGNSRPLPYAEN